MDGGGAMGVIGSGRLGDAVRRIGEAAWD
jgi:hypothetical protein